MDVLYKEGFLPNANLIYDHPVYASLLDRLEATEKVRIFCKHDLAHFLDVARIATILCHERNFSVSRDLIYTTALLHDIGRFAENEEGTPHDLASVAVAKELLPLTDFSDEEIDRILEAISDHRKKEAEGFSGIFREADKASRACFRCPARAQCNWPDSKKNLAIYY